MQIHRRRTFIESEEDATSYPPVHARTSVWIDQEAQHDVSAAYISLEEPQKPIGTKRTRDLSLEQHIQNPHTPIPARASSVKATSTVKVRPRYPRSYTMQLDDDITRNPTSPQPNAWQYEMPDYDVESSLSALSLAYPERALEDVPTIPPPQSQTVDEIDTLVPTNRKSRSAQKSAASKARKKAQKPPFPFTQSDSAQYQHSITISDSRAVSELPTMPPAAQVEATPLATLADSPVTNMKLDFLAKVHAGSVAQKSSTSLEDENSWTAGKGKNSALAKRVIERNKFKSMTLLNPLDRLRWWLVYPGRIEFLLWLSGTVVLVGVTCMLLFATLLSAGWLNTGFTPISLNTSRDTSSLPVSNTSGQKNVPGSSTACSTTDASKPQCHSTTVVTPSGLQLTLVDNAILLPGMPISVRGQGFTKNSSVNFTYDTSFPCSPSTIVTSQQGTFSVYLYLGIGVKAGIHQIEAYDVATKNLVTVNVSISPAPIGKVVSPTPTQAVPVSGVTPTATTGAGGGLPTPVGQTPVPITPTVVVSPTSVPTQEPTPTVGITPTPTIGVTPTATFAPSPTPTAGTKSDPTTPTASPTADAQTGSTMLLQGVYATNKSLHVSMPVTLWVWMAILGYAISMTLLGCAGLLYRRNRNAALR